MKKLLLIVILIGCQSQADKDRVEMQRLIDDKKRLEAELYPLKSKRNMEMDSLFNINYGSQDLRDKKLNEIPAYLSSKYPRIADIADSLHKIDTRISELKLLKQ